MSDWQTLSIVYDGKSKRLFRNGCEAGKFEVVWGKPSCGVTAFIDAVQNRRPRSKEYPLDQIIADVAAFIAAVKAGNRLTAIILGIKIAGEVASVLAGQGTPPHAVAANFSLPTDQGGLVAALEREVASPTNINLGNVLAILQGILKLLGGLGVVP